MAERRMLAKSIIESDAFMDMPSETQMLYIHLNMAADDDGFVANPRTIMRSCGSSNDSMKMLISKKFVLTFEKNDNFLIVIKHWRIHNYIRSDRYKASAYKEFMRDLYYDENKAYTVSPDGHTHCLQSGTETEQDGSQTVTGTLPVGIPDGSQTVTGTLPVGIPDGSQTVYQTGDNTDTQVRLGKDKGRIGQDREEKDSTVQGSQEEKGSGGKQTALPAPVEKPVENSTPANGETDGGIDFFAKQILIHKRHGYKTDVLYSWAANEGYSAAVIDDRIIQLEQQKEAERS